MHAILTKIMLHLDVSCSKLRHGFYDFIAISCVSLASKLSETDFSLTDFRGDGGFVFDAKTIERMEYAILGALKWRMRSITPFSFIPFFTSFFKLKDPLLRQALNSGAVEIIFKAQTNVKFLEFKPSIIAASALLSASNELFPSQFPCFHKEISSCLYVHKENMLKCYNWMEEMGKGSDGSMFDMVSSSMQHGSQCAGPAVFMFRK
ncbi:hypothetical protein V6N12_042197 [Hibiscus sabdariffa]|uniref:Cyclin C-terminal domain-containing protein n=1 Tax=Hibiscus sabdariffa TaxID=183260 RepID=A0ABR2EE29_9ROSI